MLEVSFSFSSLPVVCHSQGQTCSAERKGRGSSCPSAGQSASLSLGSQLAWNGFSRFLILLDWEYAVESFYQTVCVSLCSLSALPWCDEPLRSCCFDWCFSCSKYSHLHFPSSLNESFQLMIFMYNQTNSRVSVQCSPEWCYEAMMQAGGMWLWLSMACVLRDKWDLCQWTRGQEDWGSEGKLPDRPSEKPYSVQTRRSKMTQLRGDR